MFKFSKSDNDKEQTDIQEAINDCVSGLKGLEDGSEEYVRQASALKTLMETQRIEEETFVPWRPSADTVVTVAGSILGIVSILTFEKANVITTKALPFVGRPKA